MAMPQNFRTAFNGFHREDVVHFISYLTTNHERELSELRSEGEERENLVRQLTEQNRELMQQLEQAREERDKARQETEGLRQEADEFRQKQTRQEEELEALRQQHSLQPQQKTETSGRWTEELNAYRRAESAERRARERVNQMYDRANGALAEASVRMEHTADQITALVGKVQSDLEQLHQAMEESENTLADTAVMLGAIRPEMD